MIPASEALPSAAEVGRSLLAAEDVGQSLLAAPDGGPSLMGAALRMGLAVALLAAAAWAWLYWQRRVKGPTRQLEVLDRAFLARGASVALLRVGERRLVVGVSAEGVRLIRDMESEALPPSERRFEDVLGEATASQENPR